jgi:hypothetical protein
MTSFVNAISKASKLIKNENGALLKSTTDNFSVDAFNKLIRGVNTNTINLSVSNIIKEAKQLNSPELIKDLILMAFYKRNCRGGEGEKLITYKLLLAIYEHFPIVICNVIILLPEFGYYKDLFEIWQLICDNDLDEQSKFTIYEPLINAIMNFIKIQLNNDNELISNNQTAISLLAKWIPKQGNHYDTSCFWYFKNENQLIKIKAVKYLSYHYFNMLDPKFFVSNTTLSNKQEKWALMNYRKLITKLNSKLNVSEILMCDKNFSHIEFDKVPSKAMKNYAKAFLNESLKNKIPPKDKETGNRYPNNTDRVQCRQNLVQFIKDGKLNKLNGKQLEPHEILRELTYSESDEFKSILHSMWDRKKEDILQQIKEFSYENRIACNIGIGNCIPMIDVSGSMSGSHGSSVEPMSVAIALGIITSELASPPFNNLAISFTENPHIFKFNEADFPEEKRQHILSKEVGFSTRFDKAIELLLKLCVDNKVPSNEIPNLLVFTDGQFDEMNKPVNYLPRNNKPWSTCHEELLTMWAKAGYNRIPNIIYWNLRSNTPGFQTSSDHKGVQLLQGYSPAILKFILFGQSCDETTIDVSIDSQIVKMKVSSITPYDTFRKAIDQECYNPIRSVLDNQIFF